MKSKISILKNILSLIQDLGRPDLDEHLLSGFACMCNELLKEARKGTYHHTQLYEILFDIRCLLNSRQFEREQRSSRSKGMTERELQIAKELFGELDEPKGDLKEAN